ncbi:2Fe-2S iron-sulfur cluster-binding protein [Dokdonella sp.]|uniref:2Fe-2S iron-sulfur cluster-binding protein n=1 Tax=Dokdonella sp. TaxID=2291710 RepID=UPI0031BCBFC3|nr:2Fe-2S iron-sulfur cluster-binding protein [Dokdonella sp.]
MSHRVILASNGKRFSVLPGETVLEAARRSGLALPYSCLAGVCGSCKATLLEGACVYPRNPPSALSAAEQSRRQILLCQAVPASDLVIAVREVPAVNDFRPRTLTLRVIDKSLLGDEVVRLLLLPARGERLRRLPGQYLDVLLADGKRRAFSIANAPHDNDRVELHVRRVAGGGFTGRVFNDLAPGDQLRVEAPLGTLVPREDSERPLLMIAGGTGFAPIKALVEHFVLLGTRRPISLYWGVRDAADLYLPGLPARWAREVPGFRFVPVVSDPERTEGLRGGLVHEAVLEDLPDLSAFDVYMAGPPSMIDAGRRAFVDAGLPEERLFYDSFDYAPDVIAKILHGRAGIAGLQEPLASSASGEADATGARHTGHNFGAAASATRIPQSTPRRG